MNAISYGEALRVLALAALATLIPASSGAQSAAATAARDTAAAPAEAAVPAPAAAVVVLAEAGADGFGLRSSDGAFRLRFQGVAHYDGRAFLNDDIDRHVNGFDVRRIRADLRGTVHSQYDFRVNLDYAGNRVDVLDAYLEGRFSPAFQIRVGKFKSPVGLERLQSATALTFPERGFPTALVPNRDVGVQLQGAIGGSLASYAVGVFNGVPDGASGDSDLSDSKDFAARLFLQPFGRGPESVRGLGVGIAGTVGDQRGTPANPGLPAFRTTIGRGTFLRFRADGTDGGSAVLDGRRTRIAPQGTWYWGPAGLLAEYVRSTSDIRLAEETDRMRSTAWQVTGTWVLSGESSSYRGVTPARPFELGSRGWGAFELAGRVQHIELERRAFHAFASPAGGPVGASSLTVGLNWYVNRFVRVQSAWEGTRFEAADASAPLPDEDVLITRVQLGF